MHGNTIKSMYNLAKKDRKIIQKNKKHETYTKTYLMKLLSYGCSILKD